MLCLADACHRSDSRHAVCVFSGKQRLGVEHRHLHVHAGSSGCVGASLWSGTLGSRCCAEVVQHFPMREARAWRCYFILRTVTSKLLATSFPLTTSELCPSLQEDRDPADGEQSSFVRSGSEFRSLSSCQVGSVGLQGSSASGPHALGRLVRPRHEVPSLDRGFVVTSAMQFLKPDVQGCVYSRLSGMQYFSASRVARGHHSGRLPRARLTAKRADNLRGRSLRGSVQSCGFVCVVLLAWRCKHH